MYTRNNLPSHPAILSTFKSVTERDQNISDPHHIELISIILMYHKSLLQSAPLCQLVAATKTAAFHRMYLCHQSRALYLLPRVSWTITSTQQRCPLRFYLQHLCCARIFHLYLNVRIFRYALASPQYACALLRHAWLKQEWNTNKANMRLYGYTWCQWRFVWSSTVMSVV